METTNEKTDFKGGNAAKQSARPCEKVSESEPIRICPHRYAGCISQNGYTCTLGGPCDPCDEHGRSFTVSYVIEDGQKFMHRDFGGKKSLIDADTEQAAAIMREAVAVIQRTPFADREPFDPAKTVRDQVGS